MLKKLVETSRKNKQMLWWAEFISRVFDPIAIIPLTMVTAVWWALMNGERWRFLTLLILWDAMLPGLVLFWWIKKGNVLSGWDLRERKERLPLFLFVVVAHLGGVVGAWYLNKHPLAEYLFCFWLLAAIFALVTTKWKISVHTGVMSTMSTFLVLTQGRQFVWLFALVLLVVWARVVGRYHRLSQAIVGGVVPTIVLPVVFRILGV